MSEESRTASTSWRGRRSTAFGRSARRPRSRCATSPRITPTASRIPRAARASPCGCTAPAIATVAQIESELTVDGCAARGRRGGDAARGACRRRAPCRVGRASRVWTPRNVVVFEWLPGIPPDLDSGQRRHRPVQDARLRSRRGCTGTSAPGRAPPASSGRAGTTTSRSGRAGTGARGRTVSASARRSAGCSSASTPTIAARLRALRPGREPLRARARRLPAREPAGRRRPRPGDRLRRLRVLLVHVRLRHHGHVHGGPPARARAARRLGRGVSHGGGARAGRRSRAGDVRDAAAAADRRLDRLTPHVRARGGRARRPRTPPGHCALAEDYLSTHAIYRERRQRVHTRDRPDRPRDRRHQGHRQGHRRAPSSAPVPASRSPVAMHDVGARAVAELGADGGATWRTSRPTSASAADTERMVAETVERFGGLDVLCANAGCVSRRPAART